jgi:hypothetical protein
VLDVSDLGAVNARLRQVVAGKDELIANQSALIAGQGEQLAAQGEQLASQAELIKLLQEELAELRRRLGRDPSNSSTPSSKDSIAAKAKKKADRSSRVRSKDRKPGGLPGRAGMGLTPTQDPDQTLPVEPPPECGGCQADLSNTAVHGHGWAQVWDAPPVVLEKTHYLLPRKRCGCGTVTTASIPFGRAGTVSHGPNLNAAAIILGSEGNVPAEQCAAHIVRHCKGVLELHTNWQKWAGQVVEVLREANTAVEAARDAGGRTTRPRAPRRAAAALRQRRRLGYRHQPSS